MTDTFKIQRDQNIEYALQARTVIFIIKHNVKGSKLEGKDNFHISKVVPYLTKHGNSKDTMVFIFCSGDEYMRRAFLSRGWQENSLLCSQIFDLRWELNENNVLMNSLIILD